MPVMDLTGYRNFSGPVPVIPAGVTRFRRPGRGLPLARISASSIVPCGRPGSWSACRAWRSWSSSSAGRRRNPKAHQCRQEMNSRIRGQTPPASRDVLARHGARRSLQADDRNFTGLEDTAHPHCLWRRVRDASGTRHLEPVQEHDPAPQRLERDRWSVLYRSETCSSGAMPELMPVSILRSPSILQ